MERDEFSALTVANFRPHNALDGNQAKGCNFASVWTQAALAQDNVPTPAPIDVSLSELFAHSFVYNNTRVRVRGLCEVDFG